MPVLATVEIIATRLGGLTARVNLYAGVDTDAGWFRALRAMCAAEGVGYFDSHSAEEQERGDAEGKAPVRSSAQVLPRKSPLPTENHEQTPQIR